MSKRLPGTHQPLLTVSDEIIQRSLGPDSTKIITDIADTHTSDDDNNQYQGKLNWKDIGLFLENLKPIKDEHSTAPKPKVANSARNLLTAPLNYRICNKCNKPILDTHISEHIDLCQEIMRTKVAAKEKATAGTAEKASTKAGNTKKRKNNSAEIEDSTKDNTPNGTPAPTTKKQKKAPKEKKVRKEKAKAAPKPKEPVDVEKQCGVALPGGGFCARSLTCKTHSMGAKRAVPGRSAPYDQLLAQYQRKNQAKIAAGAAAAQAAQDELMHGSAGPLDEDEETQMVIEGVSRSYALPLEKKVIMPTRIRSGFLRMREMFANALLPRAGNSTATGIEGRTAVVDVNKTNEYFHMVRPPQRVALTQLQQQQQQQRAAQVVAQQQQQAQAASQQMNAQLQAANLTPEQQQQLLLQQRAAQARRAQMIQQQRLQQQQQQQQQQMAAAVQQQQL